MRRVLLADEPTGDLDEQTADALHALLRDMHQGYGLTSIIASTTPGSRRPAIASCVSKAASWFPRDCQTVGDRCQTVGDR